MPEDLFNTYLLTMEEVWYVRENPRHTTCVSVRRLVADIEKAEAEVSALHDQLDLSLGRLNKRRLGNGNRS